MMKFTDREREAIEDTIKQLCVIGISSKENGEVWDCAGLETEFSKTYHLEGFFKSINVEKIVKEIVAVVANNIHESVLLILRDNPGIQTEDYRCEVRSYH